MSSWGWEVHPTILLPPDSAIVESKPELSGTWLPHVPVSSGAARRWAGMGSSWEPIRVLFEEIAAEAQARGVVLDDELKAAVAVNVDATIKDTARYLGISPAAVRSNYGHLFNATKLLDTACAAVGRT